MEKQIQMDMRKNLESKLIEKAWKDDMFRKQLVNSTKETIENEAGIKIPERIKITVLEETPEEVYLVLPQEPAKMGQMLTDAELDAVAGGCSVDQQNYVPTADQNCGNSGGGY